MTGVGDVSNESSRLEYSVRVYAMSLAAEGSPKYNEAINEIRLVACPGVILIWALTSIYMICCYHVNNLPKNGLPHYIGPGDNQ